MPKKHLLPDGSATDDIEVYLAAWRELGSKVGKVIKADAFGYDPGFIFQRGRGSLCFNMSTDIALAISELVDERDSLKRELRRLHEKLAERESEQTVHTHRKTKPQV